MAEAGRIFYPSLFEALEGADDATYSETLRAVAAFAFRGEEPVGLSPLARAIFTMAKPLFEANEAKREAGRKGGNARWEAARQAKAEEKAAAVCSSANSRDCGKYSTAISAMKAANATETVTETVTETGTETGTETIALTETTSPTGQEKHIARKARTRTRKSPAEQKHKRGEFGHVMLTDAEYTRLCDEKGKQETDDAIRVVDEYVETSGRRPYSNYALAMRKWGYRAAAEQAAKERRAQIRPAGGFSAADYFARVARGEEAL